MAKLILLFTVVPLVELYLLMALGRVMGFWPTVALVLFTGTLGAALAKREGGRVLREWRGALDGTGAPPNDGLLEGALILVGGVLLVTPGVLTDVTGMSLLFPPTRVLWARVVRRWLDKRIADGRVHMEARVMHGTGAAGFGFETFEGPPGMGGMGGKRPGAGRRRPGAPGGVIEVEGVEVEATPTQSPTLR